MGEFTNAEWDGIGALLASEADRFGLPDCRPGSVILSSFNIRKLGGKANRSDRTWAFLADYCRRCDLVAIQEVQEDLEGLRHLKALCGDEYGLVVSDTTGDVLRSPAGSPERLAFLFRWDRLERTEVASDITYDRSAVFETLYQSRFEFWEAFESRTEELGIWESLHEERLREWKRGGETGTRPRRRPKPRFVLPDFVTFIRTPNCASFRIKSSGLEFLAINAHLLYGDTDRQKAERWMEFVALMTWLVTRARRAKRLAHPNLILFGDLNLDFDEVDEDRARIETELKSLNDSDLAGANAARVNFPFFDVHPTRTDIEPIERAVFRSTARMTSTYDQIALFGTEDRLPGPDDNATAGTVDDGFDYGVFRFSDLFAEALLGSPFEDLTKAKKQSFVRRYEHEVSDHQPIWIRLPGS